MNPQPTDVIAEAEAELELQTLRAYLAPPGFEANQASQCIGEYPMGGGFS